MASSFVRVRVWRGPPRAATSSTMALSLSFPLLSCSYVTHTHIPYGIYIYILYNLISLCTHINQRPTHQTRAHAHTNTYNASPSNGERRVCLCACVCVFGVRGRIACRACARDGVKRCALTRSVLPHRVRVAHARACVVRIVCTTIKRQRSCVCASLEQERVCVQRERDRP
jgi:hypothetical protein